MHDDENYRYVTKNGYIYLTPYENILLKLLLEQKGKVITYDDYLVFLYCEKHLCISTLIAFKELISRLRKKLKGEIEIKTKYGIGYYID